MERGQKRGSFSLAVRRTNHRLARLCNLQFFSFQLGIYFYKFFDGLKRYRRFNNYSPSKKARGKQSRIVIDAI